MNWKGQRMYFCTIIVLLSIYNEFSGLYLYYVRINICYNLLYLLLNTLSLTLGFNVCISVL